MRCPTCEYTLRDEDLVCTLCGEVLNRESPIPPRHHSIQSSPPADVMRVAHYAEAKEQEIAEARRRDLLKGYMVTGALAFALFNILFSLWTLSLLKLIIIAITSTVFGMPLGYIIGKQGGGIWKGALISSGLFIVLRLLLSIPDLLGGTAGLDTIILNVLLTGVLTGAIPGAIIGWHVENTS